MPIRIVFDPERRTVLGAGSTHPVLECDCCGLRIEDAREAVFCWNEADDHSARGAQAFFAHRTQCVDALAAQMKARNGKLAMDDLEMLPGYLGRHMIPDHTAEFQVMRREPSP